MIFIIYEKEILSFYAALPISMTEVSHTAISNLEIADKNQRNHHGRKTL